MPCSENPPIGMSGSAKKCITCEKTKELTEFTLVKDRVSSNCKACREKDAEKKRRKRERERAEKREREMDEEDEDSGGNVKLPSMTLAGLVQYIQAWGSKADLEIAARVDCAAVLQDQQLCGKERAACIADHLGKKMGLMWWYVSMTRISRIECLQCCP